MATANKAMNHTAAIHVIRAQLEKRGLLDEYSYRALLLNLVGKSSCKDMNPVQQAKVRAHFDRLAEQHGLRNAGTHYRVAESASERASRAAQQRAQASPLERKFWALWSALGRDGKLDNPSQHAANAWVERQLGVSAVRFCTSPQLVTLIESLKLWQGRPSA